jgi:transposase
MTTETEATAAKVKPTKEQAFDVWQELSDPSTRKVADALKSRGFDVSYRTIARWHANAWREEGPNTPISEKVHRQLKDEHAKAQAELVEEANEAMKVSLQSAGVKDADYARIEQLVKDLSGKDLADLKEMQEKERTIMNIVMMREATRRAHIMTLIPKDTSAMIEAFTSEAKMVAPPPPLQPIGEAPKLNGHAMIEGNYKVVSPSASAIQRFLAKESAA